MKRPFAFLLSALTLTLLASCATSVRFDVEHPPLVDLRGVSSISVIPFERHGSVRYGYLSGHVTTALAAGVRNGIVGRNIDFVYPLVLTDVPERDFRRYVDVFLSGRITDVRSSLSTQTGSRTVAGRTVRVYADTLTVTVDIEYSYIRAGDGRVLGHFRKSESFTETREFHRGMRPPGDRPGSGPPHGGRPPHGSPGNWDDPGDWGGHWDWDRDRGRRRRGRPGEHFLQRGSWEESLAVSAIGRFAFTMRRELAPWTTTEERNLRRRTGNDPMLDEARRLVRMGRYEQALRIYKEAYGQSDNIFVAFNTALLLAANNRFAEALALLENLHGRLLAEGRNTPRFIRREMQRLAGFISGFRLLEEHRAGGVADAGPDRARPPAPPPPPARVEAATGREVSGTVDLGLAQVYALTGPISSAGDPAIWSKIVAAADAGGGRWSMRIPDTAPSLLWFVVTGGRHTLYITRTAIGTSGTVVLDTALMLRLE